MHDVIITAPPTPSQRNGTNGTDPDRPTEQERQARRNRIRRYIVADMTRPVRRGGSVPVAEMVDLLDSCGFDRDELVPAAGHDEQAIEEIEEAYDLDRRKDEARRLRERRLAYVADFRKKSERIGKVKVDPSDPSVALPASLIERGGATAYHTEYTLVLGGVLEGIDEAEEERVGQTKKSARTLQNLVKDIARELPETVISTTEWRVLDALLSFADPTLERGVWPKRKKLAKRAGYRRPKAVVRHVRALERKGWLFRIPTLTHAGDHGPNIYAFGFPSSVVEMLGGPSEAVRAGT